ncbi:MAG TPA: 7TM diverse intracellular signaling domain-containing protein [Pseudomonadales bacterium]|nr:7TM diverse intracellular signaling domain-containing protein [Pseudomonadales bacterium]
MKYNLFHQIAKIIAAITLLLTWSALAQSTTSQQDRTCRHINFLADTYTTIPITTEDNPTKAISFLSTDKKYDHTSGACIEIKNISGEKQEFSIRLDNPRIRHAEVFNRTDDGIAQLSVSGLDYPLKNWQALGSEILFTRTIDKEEDQIIYIQLGSIFPYNSQIIVSGTEKSFNEIISQQLASGLLAGFIFALTFYSAAIGINTKENTYLFLFGSAFFVTLLQLNDLGLLYFLWPDAMYWNNVCSGIFAVTSTLFGANLARSYLMTKGKMPRADMFLHVFVWYLAVIALPITLLENDNLFLFAYALPTVLFFLPFLVILSIIRIRQNYTPAKLYLIALSMPVIAGLFIFFMYVGLFPSSPMAKIIPLLGTALQLVFFAIALGERINWLKKQRNIFMENELAIKTESSAKKSFLAHISHELRTPLAGIIGLADLARKNPLYATNKILIDGINESAAHLLSTTNILLDHARIDAGKFLLTNKKFNPELLIKNLVKHIKEESKKKNFSISINTNDITQELLYADSDIISRIIELIVKSTLDLSPDGNILINHETFKNNNRQLFFRFDIINTSSNADDAYHSKIFEIFEIHDSSTTRKQQGIGLDLSLAKKLCDLLGGEIGYNINPQHGAAFWCVIPCGLPPANSPVDEDTSQTKLSTPEASPSKRILVAEDDETLQLIIGSQLETLQQNHIVFPNGKPLVEEYINNTQNVDMILLDWNMPICNAHDAIAAIRQYESKNHLPPVTIAVLSAHDKHNAKEMDLSPEIKLLQKPVTTDDLSRLISSSKNI